MTQTVAWILLFVAIFLEVCGTFSMKLSKGFTEVMPSVFIFVFYGLCFTAFTLALRRLELSISYAIWAGLGTVLIVILGIIYFKEPITWLKVVYLLMILIGVVGLKWQVQ